MAFRTRLPVRFLVVLIALCAAPLPTLCQSAASQSIPATATDLALAKWGPPPKGIPENATHPDISSSRACYFPPDKNKPGDWRLATTYDGYFSCPPKEGQIHTMCCQTHPGGGGNVKDGWCHNGLCHVPASQEGFAPIVQREACTDPTWKDPSCLNVCLGNYAGGQSGMGANGKVKLRICDISKLFCCGDSTQTETGECCDDWKGFSVDWPANSTHPIVTNSTGSPSPLPGAENLFSGTAGPSRSNGASKGKKDSDDIGLSGGMIAGIVAVNVLLVALAVVGIMWFRQRRRWKKRSKEHVYDEFHNRSSMLIGSDTNFGVKAELDATQRIDELDGYPRAPGLHTDSVSELGSPVSRPGTSGRLSRMGTMMSARPLSELPGSEVRTGREIEMDSGEGSGTSTKEQDDRNDSVSSAATEPPKSSGSEVSPTSAEASSSESSKSTQDSSSLRNRSSSRASKQALPKPDIDPGTTSKEADDHSIYELP